jgi:hypothetical protein
LGILKVKGDTVGKKIKDFFRGSNFMTPSVLEYGESADKKYIYELSFGKGMSNNTLYGVTVLTSKGEATDRSELLDTLSEAREYISSL